MLVVSVGVIWSLGFIALFDYEISMLMGLIPPLMIVIGVPNCIYLLNKYHGEFKKHGNKAKALTRMIQKVGDAHIPYKLHHSSRFSRLSCSRAAMLCRSLG